MRKLLFSFSILFLVLVFGHISQAAPRGVFDFQSCVFEVRPSIENQLTMVPVAKIEDNRVEVHYINVGQADAIYISLPNKNDILIDAGSEADSKKVVNYLTSRSVDDIELMIATHNHEDHIGGLPGVLEAFKVEKIIDSGVGANTKIYNDFFSKARTKSVRWETDNRQTITVGNNELQILTGPENWQDTNDNSVICRLDTGDVEFLFMGDAEGPVESSLSGQIEAEILKIGHHGSQTSTSIALLNKVHPKVAIISVGVGNKYKHPAPETIQRLTSANVTIYRTDSNGNILVTTDGKTYHVYPERCG